MGRRGAERAARGWLLAIWPSGPQAGIALGELCEAVSAVEIDNGLGGCPDDQLLAVHLLGSRLNAMLTPLAR